MRKPWEIKMNKEDVLKEMRESIGTKDPIEYFNKMTDLFQLLFSKIEEVESELYRTRVNAALAIKWEPKIASNLITQQINILRRDRDTFHNEISELKKAFVEDVVTQSYSEFCAFWQDVLGWHPFLDYRK